MAMNTFNNGRSEPGESLHQGLVYSGLEDFLDHTAPFVLEAVAADEPVLIMVQGAKIDALRRYLDADLAARVEFVDMTEVGRNPARIIDAWQQFTHRWSGTGGALAGIGEPIWAGRSPEEIDECHRHESLLNLALADGPSLRILCPYDADALTPDVIDDAHTTHPVVSHNGTYAASPAFSGMPGAREIFGGRLSDPPHDSIAFPFTLDSLGILRMIAAPFGAERGLDETQVDSLVLAVNELATNSVTHGGGAGVVRLWSTETTVVCEVDDRGTLDDPLLGRSRPRKGDSSGHGVWIVNQLCDLVQMRSEDGSTRIRLHIDKRKTVAGP